MEHSETRGRIFSLRVGRAMKVRACRSVTDGIRAARRSQSAATGQKSNCSAKPHQN
jgi:hypothetical protein